MHPDHSTLAKASETSWEHHISVLRLIDQLCDDYEQRLGTESRNEIEVYLNRVDKSCQGQLLRYLLEVELEHKERIGLSVSPEQYLLRFRDLESIVQSVFDSQSWRRRSVDAVQPIAIQSELSNLDTTAYGYALGEEIGRGGMGMVYRAEHCDTGEVVALKTLYTLHPEELSRFKREFRVAAGICHPNVIRLWELVCVEQRCFITMEFLQGNSLNTFAKTSLRPLENDWTPRDIEQFVDKLQQIANGVNALHAVGVIHRDLKPANVFVTETGRCVVLDFGLAGETNRLGQYESLPGHISGTISYMAPEQASAQSHSAAADWYAYGVLMYELLTGRLPFTGSVLEVLRAKVESDPVPPTLITKVPDAINDLCVRLLSRDSSERPGYSEITAVLTSFQISEGPSEVISSPATEFFVGRAQELTYLQDAFQLAINGASVCAQLIGESGSGKSSLIREFLHRVEPHQAIVLNGKCYSRELIAFNAFDGIVEAICHRFRELTDIEAAAILPRDLEALVKLFPAFTQLPVVDALLGTQRAFRPEVHADLHSAAVGAMRELLSRLSDRYPVILSIDDFQWADEDSMRFLTELLRPPHQPRILVVLASRNECDESESFIELQRISESEPSLAFTRRHLPPLSFEDSIALAKQLIEVSNIGDGNALADSLAKHAHGNPMFIEELCRAGESSTFEAQPDLLQTLIGRRIKLLGAPQRRILETVVLCSRPVPESLLYHACPSDSAFTSTIADLTAGRYLKLIGRERGKSLAVYHDRIADVVLERLGSQDRISGHRALVEAAHAVDYSDDEFLAFNYAGAGEALRAASHYWKAGDTACESAAFAKAAELYRKSIELGDWSEQEVFLLREKQANSFAAGGMSVRAAEKYLLLAEDQSSRSLEFQIKAAGHLLKSGSIEEGRKILVTAIKAVGLKYPHTPLRALIGVLKGQATTSFKVRSNEVPLHAEDVALKEQKLDACWAAATGLSIIDPIRGAYFHTQGLKLALKASCPDRLLKSLVLEVLHSSVSGPGSIRKTDTVLALAEQLKQKTDSDDASALLAMARGMRAFLYGEFGESSELLDRAVSSFVASSNEVGWELATCRSWLLLSHVFLGSWKVIETRLPTILTDARMRGDLYAEVYLSTLIQSTLLLALDQPDFAEAEIQSAVDRWSPEGFHVQDHNALMALTSIRLYQGDGAAALSLMEGKQATYRRAMLWRVQQVRIDFLQLYVRSAIMSLDGDDSDRVTRKAVSGIRALKRESALWGRALGCYLECCLNERNGIRDRNALRDATAMLEQCNLQTFSMVGQYRLQQEHSHQAGSHTLDWLEKQCVKRPDLIINSFSPGFKTVT